MAVSTYQCRNAEGRPKAGYVSEHAAKAACARSPRWRLRKSWPTAYLCFVLPPLAPWAPEGRAVKAQEERVEEFAVRAGPRGHAHRLARAATGSRPIHRSCRYPHLRLERGGGGT